MRGAILATSIVCAIVLACGEDRPPCYRGDFIGCSCDDGARGYQACREAEDGYGACVCDGTTPGVDAGTSSDAAIDAALDTGKLALYVACNEDAECESGLCFEYGMGQRLCSKTCTLATAPADCPPPSSGCNGKGTCKPP